MGVYEHFHTLLKIKNFKINILVSDFFLNRVICHCFPFKIVLQTEK